MNESYLDRNCFTTMNNGTSFVTGINNVVAGISSINTEIKVNLLKKPSELTVEIYLNSTEDDIKNQIMNVKNQIKTIESASKSTAIVDFLKEQL